ncbi:hypothetical protein [Alkalihalobacillus sp. BA299]|uniref:hypothetical protein n=1 Tax=Alkalihalobacillus sp. BA299 TaxID=2815938 RepID=UPI001ADC45A1|nr:hypothetical protein [Alkalihalobacillus sp. BA299]
MNFDFDKFVSNLKQYEVKEELNEPNDKKGLSKVIEHVWLHSSTDSINFDSFTLEDVEAALEEMDEIPLVYDDGGEMFTCDPHNLFFVFEQLFGVCFDLTNSKNKQFVLDDDDLFI